MILPSGTTTHTRPRKVAQASALELHWTPPCAAVGAIAGTDLLQGLQDGRGLRHCLCSPQEDVRSSRGHQDSCKTHRAKSRLLQTLQTSVTKTFETPSFNSTAIQLLFPRVSRQLERPPEAALAQRGPRGPGAPRSWDGGPAHAAPALRPPLPAQTCSVSSFFLG